MTPAGNEVEVLVVDDAGASDPGGLEPGARRRRTARWVSAGVAVVVLGFIALLATREPAQSTVAPSPLEGKPAPSISRPDLDGERVTLETFRGRWVVVNFFATWCVPCQREHPELMEFAERHPDEVQVLAVLFDDDPERARAFFEEHGGDWPVLVDPNGQVALDYGVRGPPESFLISPEGVVAFRIVGEVTASRLDALVAEGDRLRAAID